jgi:hypothetical protein
VTKFPVDKGQVSAKTSVPVSERYSTQMGANLSNCLRLKLPDHESKSENSI